MKLVYLINVCHYHVYKCFCSCFIRVWYLHILYPDGPEHYALKVDMKDDVHAVIVKTDPPTGILTGAAWEVRDPASLQQDGTI